MKKRTLIGIVLLVALLLVLTGCEKDPLGINLRVCGCYGVPGMMCREIKGTASVAEVLETDEQGRVLCTYTTKSIITGQKETATVIMQAADSEHVYFYEDLCYCLGAPALDSEEIKALKAQNDWGKELDYTKMAARTNWISYDGYLMPRDTLDYQRVNTAVCQNMGLKETQKYILVYMDNSPAGHELYWMTIDGKEGPEYYCILAYSNYKIASMPATGTLEDLPRIAAFKQENGWLTEAPYSFVGIVPPTPQTEYPFPDMDYTLDFPKSWANRAAVQADGSFVTVSIDGKPIYSLAALRNEPGAQEADLDLEAEGYSYFRQNGTHFFYYKPLGEVPIDLYIAKLSDKKAIATFWHINEDTEVCSVLEEQNGDYLSLKTASYTDHRLGITFTIPDAMKDRGPIYLRPAYDDRQISLVLAEESAFGEMQAEYLLCTFLALPVEDPLRAEYNIVDSPELIYHNGTLYGGVNEWRNSCWRENAFISFGWETYPEHIQNTFSFEDVQAVVDSFRLLFPLEENK